MLMIALLFFLSSLSSLIFFFFSSSCSLRWLLPFPLLSRYKCERIAVTRAPWNHFYFSPALSLPTWVPWVRRVRTLTNMMTQQTVERHASLVKYGWHYFSFLFSSPLKWKLRANFSILGSSLVCSVFFFLYSTVSCLSSLWATSPRYSR